MNHEFVQDLQQRGTPFVLLGGHALPHSTNSVMANYAFGIAEAVDHLIARGRQHIGLVNGPDSMPTSQERWNGFCVSLAWNGLPFSTEQTIAGMFEANDGYTLTQDLLKQYPAVDAIVYAHNITAMGGMTALKEHGCRIPDDVTVIGCHNYEISKLPTLL